MVALLAAELLECRVQRSQIPVILDLETAGVALEIARRGIEHEIALGLRHAAANFSAYTFFRTEHSPKDPNDVVENFVAMFEHYLGMHKPDDTAGQGLAATIAKAQEDL